VTGNRKGEQYSGFQGMEHQRGSVGYWSYSSLGFGLINVNGQEIVSADT